MDDPGVCPRCGGELDARLHEPFGLMIVCCRCPWMTSVPNEMENEK